jgi:hypothetical protein
MVGFGPFYEKNRFFFKFYGAVKRFFKKVIFFDWFGGF